MGKLSFYEIGTVYAMNIAKNKLAGAQTRQVKLRKRIMNKKQRMYNAPSDTQWLYQLMIDTLNEQLKSWEGKEKNWAIKMSILSGDRPADSQIDLSELRRIPLDRIGDIAWEQTYNHRKRCKCPFHNEKTASLVWYVDTNRWYCFGCCKGGSVIDWYMLIHRVDVKRAIKELIKYL